jgi:hypothetical protein
MQLQLFETDIEELGMLVGVMKVGRSLLHCKLHDRRRQRTKSDWSPKLNPRLLPRSIARSAYFGIVLS